MQPFTELIKALATLLWPIAFLIIIFRFEVDIKELFKRLRRGKILGQELELDQTLADFQEKVSQSESQVPLLDYSMLDESKSELISMISEAKNSPKSAFILLSIEIEKELRRLMAGMGYLDKNYGSLEATVERFCRDGFLSKKITLTLKVFKMVRNQVVHGHHVSAEQIYSAIDSGLILLKVIKSIPHEINVVYLPDVCVYSDRECKIARTDVHGIILETVSSDGNAKSLRIFPTRKTHFVKGKRVAWEWNDANSWGETWYIHPDSKEVAHAWSSSLEFVGRNLEEV